MKIQCRILLLDSETNKADVQPEDFVVYDETFVRAATLVTEGPTTTLKRAVLSCDPRKVRHYAQKRNDFKTRSEPAEAVFKRLDAALAQPASDALVPTPAKPAKAPEKLS
jgi:hypothetical protein